MGTGLTVHGHHRPAVRQNLGEMSALVNHRLDRKNVTHLDLRAQPGPAVIRNLRILVHPAANPVTNVIAHNRITISLCVLLHSPTDVTQMFSGATLFDRTLETLFSHANQFEPIFGDLTYGNRGCRCLLYTS